MDLSIPSLHCFLHVSFLHQVESLKTKPHLKLKNEFFSQGLTEYNYRKMIFVFFPLPLFNSEQPSAGPTRQRLPAGSPGRVSPAARHPVAGDRPRQSVRAARLQPRPGAEQRRAASVWSGGQRWRDRGSRTEPWRLLRLGGAKRRPGPLQTPARQSQVSAGLLPHCCCSVLQIFRGYSCRVQPQW